jgi:glycosyltransferase involved in cell wall biosynthesis
VLEALAHGLPVVCTDRGGPGAIVNDRCGRVVQTSGRTKDEVIGEMADALHELSCDRVLLRKLGAGARARAWDFDFHKVAERVHPFEPVPTFQQVS